MLLIQDAVILLDGATIDDAELAGQRYGQSTANAVLAYKKRRRIINPAYQATADNIVGKMTIASLDDEMFIRETALFTFTGGGAGLIPGLLAAPKVQSTAKMIVVTEVNSPWFAWAKQFEKAFRPLGWGMVTIPNGVAPANVAHQLKLAATRAGPRGALILSVGHGATIADINGETGFFDLGPKSSFRVGGRDAVMIVLIEATETDVGAAP